MEFLIIVFGFYLFIVLSWFFFTRRERKTLNKLSSGKFVSDMKLALASSKTPSRTRPEKYKGERKKSALSNCDLCYYLSKRLKDYTVYTAHVWGFRRKTGFKQYEVTTRYRNIKEHCFHICPRCRLLRAWIFPILVSIVIWSALVFVIGEGQFFYAQLWWASLWLAVPASIFVIYKYISLQRQLIRLAVSKRKVEDPEKEIVGLSKLDLDVLKRGK